MFDKDMARTRDSLAVSANTSVADLLDNLAKV